MRDRAGGDRGRWAATAFCCAALALGGCSSDEDKVRETVKGFAASVRVRDYRGICQRYLTNRLIEQMRLVAPCPDFLRRTYSGPAFDPNFAVGVTDIQLKGDRGTVTLQVITRRKTATGQVQVAREGQRWGLASVP